ncbi:fmp23p [Saccharomyces arboricola H-6]|uniref:Fmp23p n=1 Tax=Saccharomyces arboricola (strain H-6 / AS 2.3317 / CBS 10644) TaxID=1160507 RepID=J8QB50_SACAR|nr:fmp23p [Saccharomyces arboricola H-6]
MLINRLSKVRPVRHFFNAKPIFSKEVSRRVIVAPASHFKNSNTDGKSIIPIHEYKQLPEDSNYIEKHYKELQIFLNEFLIKKLNKTYADFEGNPDELVFQLEKFIELEVTPKCTDHSTLNDRERKFKSVGDRIVVDRYLDFVKDVRLTLLLNGGHSFIFDVMLQAKDVFDKMQKE